MAGRHNCIYDQFNKLLSFRESIALILLLIVATPIAMALSEGSGSSSGGFGGIGSRAPPGRRGELDGPFVASLDRSGPNSSSERRSGRTPK